MLILDARDFAAAERMCRDAVAEYPDNADFAWALITAQANQGDMDRAEAAFDMHRTALYQQLRWPLPTDPANEQAQGKLITTYLQLGSDEPTPKFTPPR